MNDNERKYFAYLIEIVLKIVDGVALTRNEEQALENILQEINTKFRIDEFLN